MTNIADYDILWKNQIREQYAVIPQVNHWRRRKINVYGDERCNSGWINYLQDYLDLDKITSYATSITTITTQDDCTQLKDQITTSSSDPIDAALVLCGIHDYALEANLGTVLTTSSTILSTNETELMGGVNATILAFITKFGADIPLIFITGFPHKMRYTANTGSGGSATPWTMFGLDRAINDVAHRYYHYPTIRADDCGIDMGEGAAFYQTSIYSSDNIVLNDLGDKRFARFLSKRLGQIYLRGN